MPRCELAKTWSTYCSTITILCPSVSAACVRISAFMSDPLHANRRHPCCPGVSRRTFLADTGLGITGLALGAMLSRDGIARAADPADVHSAGQGQSIEGPHFPPRAKSVIWIFLCG